MLVDGVLLGVCGTDNEIRLDAGALNREMVSQNETIVGSVNANLTHYATAAQALARTDADWLHRLVTRRVPVGRATEAIEAHEGDIKVVLDLQDAS